jgi:hypothetical protein
MEIITKELTRIEDLTRRYARYSRSQAGLSAAWGGLCLALLGGFVLCNDLVSYSSDRGLGGSSGFWGSLQEHAAAGWEKQPLLNSIALALPVLWLLGRAWIQRRVYERHGLVIESRTQQDVGAHRFFDIAEIGQAGCFIFGAWIHLAFVGFQAARLPDILLSNAVILLPPILGRRMVSFGDRLALLLLCLGSGTVLAGGFSESLLAAMLAYMALGVAQLIFGIRAHGQFCKVRRELDGLPTERADPPAGTEAASTETRSFAPRMLPRNGGDFAVALSIGAVQTALLFVLPALGTAALTRSWAIGEYAFFLLLGVFLSFTVEKITINRDGVRFHRIFGCPKFLAWERIVAVEEVSRNELIVRGWLWPLFPPREMTACLSSIGHYRITWNDGCCFFPPADAPQFEACVARRIRHRQDPDPTPAATANSLQP